MGHGSRGGRCWRKFGKWRIRTRTNSLLQSQKLVNSSRSSSGVSRSEENVVRGEIVAALAEAKVRLLRTAFMLIDSSSVRKLRRGPAVRCQKTNTQRPAQVSRQRSILDGVTWCRPSGLAVFGGNNYKPSSTPPCVADDEKAGKAGRNHA